MNQFLKMMLSRGYWDEANGGDGTGGSAGGDGGQGGDKEPTGSAGKTTPTDDSAKTKISDEEARLLKENMKRKNQIDKLSEELTTVKSVLKQLEDLGGMDAVKGLVSEKKDAETKALEAKGDYERLKQRMAEEHAKEVKTLKEQLESMNAKLSETSTVIGNLTVGSEFGRSQFIAMELTLTPTKARAIYGEYFDIQDGQVVGFDKPRGSQNRTALVDQYGNPVPFDHAMRKIVEADPEKDHLLRSKVKPGAGSSSGKQGSASQATMGKATDPLSRIANGLRSSGMFNTK
ncbi:DUF6651 domain-containing protein [Ferrovum sp.]|uniref:DUF6651 domain-containing protein n=1 Tax=Ferrovum sp. TaxID=2609467 RepID=UPI002615EAE0|nr:DUF6651 domain-containing protein [Ferrovum sp.]